MVADWKEIIETFEKKRDWKGAIDLLQYSDRYNLDVYLRVMFLLVYSLAEDQHSDDEIDYISNCLKRIYNKAESEYSENSQFLFYTAIIMYIGEWYFGVNIEFINQMLEKAKGMETENLLYKLGYYSYLDQRPEKNSELKLQLSEQILFKESAYINSLKGKGLLGEYILGTLEATYEDLKNKKTIH